MNTQSGYEINEETRFGGFWIRVLAYFIDMAILTSVGIAIGIIFIFLEMEMNSPLINIFGLVTGWIYFSVLDSSSWQTSVR